MISALTILPVLYLGHLADSFAEMRPVGGWLSDRYHPVPVLLAVFGAVAGLALLAPPRRPRSPPPRSAGARGDAPW